jgi:hypothetical protein
MSVFFRKFNNGFGNGPTKKLLCVSSKNFENSNKISNLEFGGHAAGKISNCDFNEQSSSEISNRDFGEKAAGKFLNLDFNGF